MKRELRQGSSALRKPRRRDALTRKYDIRILYLLGGFVVFRKKCGNVASSYELKLLSHIRGGCERRNRTLDCVISCTFRWTWNTFFQPEQFEKVVFPACKRPGYAPGCGLLKQQRLTYREVQQWITNIRLRGFWPKPDVGKLHHMRLVTGCGMCMASPVKLAGGAAPSVR